MIVLLGLFIASLIIWLYSLRSKALLNYEYRYKLEALKKELKSLVKEEKVDPGSWAFKYLEHSIDIAYSNLIFFNYYTSWSLSALHWRDKDWSAFVTDLNAEMNQPKNVILKAVAYRFENLLVEYVIKKHKIFRQFFLKVHKIRTNRNNRDRRKPQSEIINKIRKLRIYPETSASRDFF